MDSELLQSLTGSNGSNSLDSLGSRLDNLLAFVTIFSLLITVVFVVLWVTSWLHRRKVQNAIIDIRDAVREINQRQAAALNPPADNQPASAPMPDPIDQTNQDSANQTEEVPS